jgi:hypothetical protein
VFKTPNFDSYESLFAYINRSIKISLQQIGKEVEKLITDFILENWYNEHTPQEYLRTYQMVNSLRVGQVKQIGDNYSVELYFDTSEIQANEVTDSMWNQHMSLSKTDVSEWIPYDIEYGQNSPIYSYKGIHMMENMSKENLKIMQSMLLYLNSKGFDCIIIG